ncbi:hypothetical protein [uncultured Vagococcus sp.]|nr:hypothetical protein [uncultured Vagococcus sp.]
MLETILAVTVAVVGLITAIVKLVTAIVEAKKELKNNRQLLRVRTVIS